MHMGADTYIQGPVDEVPWGSALYGGDALHDEMPDTGVTRHYFFDIARARLSPDGYEKDMIVINGQFPGPLIEANWGDWIEVVVTNSIVEPEEGTAVHWHAFLQKDTPWYDGVPSGKL
jgi:FtsP/CotA-like multicopper oxidase with cupredoxin domain